MNYKKIKCADFSFKWLVPGLLGLSVLLSACGDTLSTATPTAAGITVAVARTPALTIESATSSKSPTFTPAPSSSKQTPFLSVATTKSATTNAVTPGQANTTPEVAGGEVASGDEPVKTYPDPAGQFSFQYPQSWGVTTQPGETVRYTGRDEFISVSLVKTNLGAVEFGKTDLASLMANSSGFKGSAVKVYQVAGTNGAVIEYTWQAGPSPVTNKTVPSSAKRY